MKGTPSREGASSKDGNPAPHDSPSDLKGQMRSAISSKHSSATEGGLMDKVFKTQEFRGMLAEHRLANLYDSRLFKLETELRLTLHNLKRLNQKFDEMSAENTFLRKVPRVPPHICLLIRRK